MRWTDDQYADWQRRHAHAATTTAAPRADWQAGNGVVATRSENASTGRKFKSKAEARYALHLDALRLAGEIRAWDYEALTLVVGRAGSMVTRYTPDFTVEDRDGRIELREVKGTYIREDARVKLLSAVRQWPGFRWMLVIDRRGTFSEEWL
jgi:hypothetical protein